MGWSRGAVVVGLLLLLAGFAVGVAPREVGDRGQETTCGSVLLGDVVGREGAPSGDRSRVESEELCAAGTVGARRSTWALLIGGLVTALSGWTVIRERERDRLAPPTTTR